MFMSILYNIFFLLNHIPDVNTAKTLTYMKQTNTSVVKGHSVVKGT